MPFVLLGRDASKSNLRRQDAANEVQGRSYARDESSKLQVLMRKRQSREEVYEWSQSRADLLAFAVRAAAEPRCYRKPYSRVSQLRRSREPRVNAVLLENFVAGNVFAAKP